MAVLNVDEIKLKHILVVELFAQNFTLEAIPD